MGRKPASWNHAAELFFAGGAGHARGAHHVFLDQDRAHVVAAEAQGDLADFVAGGQPRGLHVLDVIQVDAGDGQGLEVIHRRHFFLNEVAERGVGALKEPGNESGEAAGLFLQLADALEMVDPMLNFTEQKCLFQLFQVLFRNRKNHFIDHLAAQQIRKFRKSDHRIRPREAIGQRCVGPTLDTHESEQAHSACLIFLQRLRNLRHFPGRPTQQKTTEIPPRFAAAARQTATPSNGT